MREIRLVEVKMLLYLLKTPNSWNRNGKTLSKKLNITYSTIFKTLKRFKEEGLIKTKNYDGRKKTNELTIKGKDIAEHLDKIIFLLGERK